MVGETILAKSFSIRCGGKGLNQAVAIAKLVSDPSVLSFVSSIGNDHNAQIILDTLDRYHMTRDCLVVNSTFSTGLTNICIDQNGENTIVVVPGANAQLIPSQVLLICLINCSCNLLHSCNIVRSWFFNKRFRYQQLNGFFVVVRKGKS